MRRIGATGGSLSKALGFACVLSLAGALSGCGVSNLDDRSWENPLPAPKATDGITTGSTAPVTRHSRQIYVRPGDTAYSLARVNGITVPQLASANNLAPPYALSVGQRLTIPSGRVDHIRTGSIPAPRAATPRAQPSTVLISVQPGDTLYSISKRYGTTVPELARINNIQPPYALRLGQRLTVPGRIGPPRAELRTPSRIAAAAQPRPAAGTSRNRDYIYYFHKVKPGETLPSIARQYRVEVATLATFNQLQQSARLRTGQVIRVPM
ncbi:MAG: LysM peptidoglycan-binding domain-containing protein [Pseudomonadota bacterium]